MAVGNLFPRNETTIINREGTEINLNASGSIITEFPEVQSVVFNSAQDVNITSGNVGIIGVSDVAISTGQVYAVQSGAFVISGEVSFPSAQSVQFDSAQDVNVTGTTTVQFGSAQDVNITSGDVGITGVADVAISAGQVYAVQSGAYVISGEVTFPSAQDVVITSSGTLDVDVVTAELSMLIASSAVTIDVFTTGDNIEQHAINVGLTSTTQSWTNDIKSFIFYNASGALIHFNEGGAATTTHYPILPKQTFAIDIKSQDTRFIADVASGTIYAMGVY